MERARSRRTSTRSRKALVLSRFPPNAQPWRDLCSVVAARGAHALRRRDDGVESGEKPTLACGPRPRCAFACAARASVRARRASPRGRRRARGHENAEDTGWQNLNSRVSGSRGVPCWRLGGRRGRFCATRTARVVGRKFSNRHRSTFSCSDIFTHGRKNPIVDDFAFSARTGGGWTLLTFMLPFLGTEKKCATGMRARRA